MKEFGLSIFIFRRDLRLHDNTGLRLALERSERVLPVFFLDPRQAGAGNSYRGNNGLKFLFNSLQELDRDLQERGGRLYLFEGRAEDIVAELLGGRPGGREYRTPRPDAVFLNRDYTPFSIKRDGGIARVCERHGASFESAGDLLLNEPETTLKADGTPYTIFTPFYRRAREIPVPVPRGLPRGSRAQWFPGPVQGARFPADLSAYFKELCTEVAPELFCNGGRKEAIHILKNLGRLSAYEKRRNLPAEAGTSGLSPHNKFGTISPREFYHAVRRGLGPGHSLLRQLYWRDFLTSIAFFFPRVFGRAFQKRYESIRWRRDERAFDAWRLGRTGFPIVDAGMRELRATGFMHNRVRMITASFLCKDLHIDWRYGEKHFARHLLDYDPAVNNGNWQWAASIGCDAQPYFRVFNPWLQQKKFDADCEYIRRWVPELRELPPSVIHKLEARPLMRPADYPAPIVEHGPAARAIKARFKNRP